MSSCSVFRTKWPAIFPAPALAILLLKLMVSGSRLDYVRFHNYRRVGPSRLNTRIACFRLPIFTGRTSRLQLDDLDSALIYSM